MSKTLFENTRRARTTASFLISEYEKTVILRRLGKAVEKLKEARKEIHTTTRLLLRMREAGDDLAEPAIAAVAEMCHLEGSPWILSENAKAKMKIEAAKPLPLLRAD
jgi:hypothetical protein